MYALLDVVVHVAEVTKSSSVLSCVVHGRRQQGNSPCLPCDRTLLGVAVPVLVEARQRGRDMGSTWLVLVARTITS